MSDPSPALAGIAAEFVQPRHQVLVELLRQARPDLGPEALRLTALSISAQSVFYQLALPVGLRLLGRERMTSELLNSIAEHIADFSLRALGLLDGDLADGRRQK